MDLIEFYVQVDSAANEMNKAVADYYFEHTNVTPNDARRIFANKIVLLLTQVKFLKGHENV
jgi:hypothetical protein